MNDIEKEFVPYKESLELKELGFNKECLKWYTNANNLSDDHIFLQYSEDKEFAYAPTFPQAFRWFREKFNIVGYINPTFDSTKIGHYTYDWFIKLRECVFIKDGDFNSYEEAELECLRELIEKVKK